MFRLPSNADCAYTSTPSKPVGSRFEADVVIEDGTAACNASIDHDIVQRIFGARSVVLSNAKAATAGVRSSEA